MKLVGDKFRTDESCVVFFSLMGIKSLGLAGTVTKADSTRWCKQGLDKHHDMVHKQVVMGTGRIAY